MIEKGKEEKYAGDQLLERNRGDGVQATQLQASSRHAEAVIIEPRCG